MSGPPPGDRLRQPSPGFRLKESEPAPVSSSGSPELRPTSASPGLAHTLAVASAGASRPADSPSRRPLGLRRQPPFRPLALLAALPLFLQVPLARSAETLTRRPPTWADIDTLRSLLMAHGTRVVQSDCNQPGLQGLYHDNSDTIVICRVHRDPQAVWNTLAHEATHRMQACAGGTITKPDQRQAMASALATYAPDEWRSIRIYPRDQQLGELEARYTARLPPDQIPRLFRRYCGGPSAAAPSTPGRIPSSLSQALVP